MNEELQYLENWIKEAVTLARQIREHADREKRTAIFTIAATVKVSDKKRPYLTPLRQISHGFVGGSIVFSQTQAILLCKHIDGLVDWILVDAEKKIPISFGYDQEIFSHFNVEVLGHKKGYSREHIEMGNLSAACALYVKQSDLKEYKANDITVDAVWHILSHVKGILSGKKIAIVGAGNIGFKIALKLVESGCNVELVRRDVARGTLMADVINAVKPTSTFAIAHYNADPLKASVFADAIIGCTNGIPVITWEMIAAMRPDGVVIDVGKGTIDKGALKKGIEQGVLIIRADVAPGIDGLISTIRTTRNMMKNEMGRRTIQDGIHLVSGGFMGLDGDIVVDNFKTPAFIIGVSNGMGDIKQKLSGQDSEKINQTRKILGI